MDWKLWLGIFLTLLFIISGVVRGLPAFQQNQGAQTNIERIIAIIGTMASLLGLIMPGVKDTYIYGNLTQNAETIVNQSGDVELIGIKLEFKGPNKSDSSVYEDSKRAEDISQYETVDSFTVGWSDSEGGRPEYSIDDINSGALGSSIVFNSISNSIIGHEFNFVAARENKRENLESDFTWNADSILAENGKTYLVRLYVHNNSPLGNDAVAKDVRVRFSISNMVYVAHNDISIDGFNSANGYYATAVHGYIISSNAEPQEYSDGVKFVSDRPFHLEYIEGASHIYNNSIGAQDGYSLSDSIIKNGVLIGYDTLNGEIPGCYQYSSISCITVMPVFDD